VGISDDVRVQRRNLSTLLPFEVSRLFVYSPTQRGTSSTGRTIDNHAVLMRNVLIICVNTETKQEQGALALESAWQACHQTVSRTGR
jgi:hypothetical protein